MFIESIALNNFRNYENGNLTFSEGINILYGDNAQGKTNVLEAIYMLATTKSHRGNKDKEIIKINESESHIRAEIMKNDVKRRIDMHLRKSKSKGVAIDMIPIKKSAELFGLMNVIFFSPQDLDIIKDGPSERRRFIDMELCQLNKIYYSDLTNYNKVLDQRNNLLKQISFQHGSKFSKNNNSSNNCQNNQDNKNSQLDMLEVWNMQLVDYGNKVIKERQHFTDMLTEMIIPIHKKLTSGKETIKIVYEKNVNEDDFFYELADKQDIDIRMQTTQIGPHRDDMIFYINDMDVRKYGSQGQQRTVALALKLAEIELVKKLIHDNPILLLDDVMSELDSTRRNSLLEYIKDIQTIITCTGYDDFIKERLSIDKIYKIESGKVFEQVQK